MIQYCEWYSNYNPDGIEKKLYYGGALEAELVIFIHVDA